VEKCLALELITPPTGERILGKIL